MKNTKKTIRLLFFASVFSLNLTNGAAAQDRPVSVEVRVDSAQVTVGDPVHYVLLVRREDDTQFQEPEMQDHFGLLELRDWHRLADRTLADGLLVSMFEYDLVAWKPGEYQIEPITIEYVTADGDTGSVRSQAIQITVESVRIGDATPQEAEDIWDIKGPLTIAGRVPWGLIGIVLLVLAGAGIGVWRYLRRKRRPIEQAGPAGPPKPFDALAELDRIAAMGLLRQGRYKDYYSLVSEALRRAIEQGYGVEVLERTTYQLSVELRQDGLSEPKVREIEAFLSECDLVKFAKFIPDMQTMEGAVARAKGIVRESVKRET
ncbi:MAG: BatD family protein [Candidatus Latescibacterota bacterium]